MSTVKEVEVFGAFGATAVLTIEGNIVGTFFNGTYKIIGGNEEGPVSGVATTAGTVTTVTVATPSSVQNSVIGTITIDDTTGVAAGAVDHTDATPTVTNVVLNGTCAVVDPATTTDPALTATPTCEELLDHIWRQMVALSSGGRQIVRVRYEDEEVWFKNEDYSALLAYYNQVREMCPTAANNPNLPDLSIRRGRPGRGYVVC